MAPSRPCIAGLFVGAVALGATDPRSLGATVQCPDGAPPPCRRPAARAAAPAANSVAVLYFENLSRDTTDDYLADGLTEEITSKLGQVGRLTVTSRTNVRRLRGSAATMSATDLGRTLNVAYLVNGTTRRAGTRLRVSVELLRASTGVQVWSNQYDRSADDLLTIQEDIAVAVAAGITGQLLPGERASLSRRLTRDPAAYDLYLRGSRAFNNQGSEGVMEAITSFESALRLDPGFTAARGRLAYAYGWAVNWEYPVPGVPPESVVAVGLATAERALREDSSNADAWHGLGFLLFIRHPPDHARSLAALQRAVLLDSANALAHQSYAVVLRRLGNYDAARAEYLLGSTDNPNMSQALSDLGFIELSLRRYREAIAWYDTAISLAPNAMWPSYLFRARARLHAGDTAGARTDAASGVQRAPASGRLRVLIAQAGIEAAAGDSGASRERVRSVAAALVPATGPVGVRVGWEVVSALVAAGHREQALALLERIEPRGPWLWSYLVFPDFDPVRADPRFQRVYREAKPPGAPDPPTTR